MTQAIPTLATARLTLRPLVPSDFEAFAALLASPRARFMGGPFDRARAWGVFCHEIALWDLYGFGGLAADLRRTGETVGVVEINAGPLFPETELGWQLYAPFEGQGYATEAASALLDWARREARLPTLVSYFDPQNSRSIAVAQRLGGAPDPAAPRQDPGDLVYRYYETVL